MRMCAVLTNIFSCQQQQSSSDDELGLPMETILDSNLATHFRRLILKSGNVLMMDPYMNLVSILQVPSPAFLIGGGT